MTFRTVQQQAIDRITGGHVMSEIIAELKAKHAAMTPGTLHPRDTKTGGYHLEVIPSEEPGLRTFMACWLKEEDVAGLAAMHNHFPELMRRYEEIEAENAKLRRQLDEANARLAKIKHEVTGKKGQPEKKEGVSVTYLFRCIHESPIENVH